MAAVTQPADSKVFHSLLILRWFSCLSNALTWTKRYRFPYHQHHHQQEMILLNQRHVHHSSTLVVTKLTKNFYVSYPINHFMTHSLIGNPCTASAWIYEIDSICYDHSTCGNVICRSCLSNGCKNKCPHCQADMTTIVGGSSTTVICPRPFLRMLDALVVQCSSCSMKMPRERLLSHEMTACPQACPNYNNGKGGCNVRVTRSSMSSHLDNECKYQIVICTAAKVMCPWKGLTIDRAPNVATCHYVALTSVLESLQTQLASAHAINSGQVETRKRNSMSSFEMPSFNFTSHFVPFYYKWVMLVLGT
jgi:hypothetical protein